MRKDEMQPRIVRIVRGGRAYNGTFREVAGKLSIDSAYGSACDVSIGKADPKVVAERAFDQIIARQTRY